VFVAADFAAASGLGEDAAGALLDRLAAAGVIEAV